MTEQLRIEQFKAAKLMTGIEMLEQAILDHGIRLVFTVRSKRLTPLVNALEANIQINVIQARDEIAATAMADAYSRRSHEISIILTDGGGRALSQVSALTNAWADKTPLLSLALCEDDLPDPNKGINRRRFDQTDVFRAITHRRHRIHRIEEIMSSFDIAVSESTSGKMGPVHLDIPVHFLTETMLIPGRREAVPHSPLISPLRMPASSAAIEHALSVLFASANPFCICGHGVIQSEAEAVVARLLTKLRIPVTTSMAGIGAVSSQHECFIGGPSYAAGEVFHTAIKRADCVLAFGFAFGGLEGFGRPPLWSDKIQFIHVDIDPLQIGLNSSPKVAIQGDIRTVVQQMLDEIEINPRSYPLSWATWREKLRQMHAKREKRNLKHAYGAWRKVHQGRLAHEIGKKVVEDDLLMVLDGGNTPLYAAIYSPNLKPDQAFFPFGMAALGAGVPAAIGVHYACPERSIVMFTGDASMLYNVQEFELIAARRLPILIVINNDSAWNMIRWSQALTEACNYIGSELPDIDYAAIAAGFGFYSETVTLAEEIIPAYERARAHGGPALLNVITDKANCPDALLSFALVELEGARLEPLKVVLSVMRLFGDGWKRFVYRATYIFNAFVKNIY
jgi:acetolactate synthase-1/2/3 large subunit